MATTIFEAAELDSDLLSALRDRSRMHVSVAREFGYGETSVRRWRTRHDITTLNTKAPEEPTTTEDEGIVKGSVVETATGAEINNVVVTSPINKDWSSIFVLFNLNPDNFEVVDDTVRMSTWQQSKRLENGERDTVQLYSYSARFRRITREPETQEALREVHPSLLTPTFTPPANASKHAVATTYKFDVADAQLGKKGTQEAVANWKRGVTRHLEAAYELAPSDLHVAFQGDETENVFGHYFNQPMTVELNSSEQEQLDLELRCWTIREALGLGIPVSVSSVISNHGERRTKVGGDPMVSRGDNSSTKIARMMKWHFEQSLSSAPLTWYIGEDSTPFVTVEHSGVLSYYSHGYVEQGAGATVEKKLIDAIEKQIVGRTDELGQVRLVYLAHYHHAWSNDQRGRTFFGDPALEALKSSEWVLDRYGQWSHPGMLGMLVGHHTDRKYSNVAIF